MFLYSGVLLRISIVRSFPFVLIISSLSLFFNSELIIVLLLKSPIDLVRLFDVVNIVLSNALVKSNFVKLGNVTLLNSFFGILEILL